MKKLVLGIGNPILGDDGVGFHVINALESNPPAGDITFSAVDVSGLSLLDYLVGYDEVIIVDAIMTEGGKPGSVYRLGLEHFQPSKHTISPHDTDLPTALKLGEMMQLKIPKKISIVAIEIPQVHEFSKQCTDEVDNSIPKAVEMILSIISET